MKFLGKLKVSYSLPLLAGAVCAIGGFAAAGFTDTGKQMVVTPFQNAKFAPVNPARPDGPQMAVLQGNPATDAADVLLKLKRGEGLLHTHSSGYRAVVVEGIATHWTAGERKTDVKPLRPGSYWYQPGNQAHGDSCLSEECILFVSWEGKMDAKLAEAPTK
jgi:quercetin dioxygenase-like cupin family protein